MKALLGALTGTGAGTGMLHLAADLALVDGLEFLDNGLDAHVDSPWILELKLTATGQPLATHPGLVREVPLASFTRPKPRPLCGRRFATDRYHGVSAAVSPCPSLVVDRSTAHGCFSLPVTLSQTVYATGLAGVASPTLFFKYRARPALPSKNRARYLTRPEEDYSTGPKPAVSR